MQSLTMPAKRVRPIRPKTDADLTELLQLRVSKEFLANLDEFRRQQPNLPTRQQAVRQIVEQWVKRFVDIGAPAKKLSEKFGDDDPFD
jgi:hypothetical protein